MSVVMVAAGASTTFSDINRTIKVTTTKVVLESDSASGRHSRYSITTKFKFDITWTMLPATTATIDGGANGHTLDSIFFSPTVFYITIPSTDTGSDTVQVYPVMLVAESYKRDYIWIGDTLYYDLSVSFESV